MALENIEKLLGFTEMVDAIETWAHIVLFIAALYFVWKLIFGTEGEPASTGKETIESVGRWWKKKGKKKGERRAASRQETAELNEYIEEKKELELIDEAVKEATASADVIGKASTAGSKVPASSVKSSFDNLKKSVDDAGKETNKLKRNTWRERRKMKVLYKSLDDAEVSKGDMDRLRALEDIVLKRHDYVITNLATAAGAIRRIDSAVQSLGKIKGVTPPKILVSLREALVKEIIPALQNAQSGQRSAYKDTEDLISRIRKVWK